MKTTLLLSSVLAVLLPTLEARTWSNDTKPTETDPKKIDPHQRYYDNSPFKNDNLKNITNPDRDARLKEDNKFNEYTHGINPDNNIPSIKGDASRTFTTEPSKSITYSPDAKLHSISDTIETVPVKDESKPSTYTSMFHVGLRGTFELPSFNSSVSDAFKTHHAYVEKSYPFSLAIEAAIHRLYKLIYWDLGAFAQTDFGYTLSAKNKLEGSNSFGIFGNVGLSELIHVDKFRIIPAVGFEGAVSGKFEAFDLSVVGSLYFVYSNFYTRVGFGKGFVTEKFTLKNNDTDADENLEITKKYIQISIGYWD
jgi:hypothetical protein